MFLKAEEEHILISFSATSLLISPPKNIASFVSYLFLVDIEEKNNRREQLKQDVTNSGSLCGGQTSGTTEARWQLFFPEKSICGCHRCIHGGYYLVPKRSHILDQSRFVPSETQALDLGRGANSKSYMVEEIWQELAKAKYLEEACESAFRDKHELDCSQMEGFIGDRLASLLKQLDALDRVFRKAAEDDNPTEVPDYLCCKITLDIFRDLVITPSGVTYERAVILDICRWLENLTRLHENPLRILSWCQIWP